MATVFVLDDVKAWLDSTKLTPSAIETSLSTQITEQVFSRLRPTFPSAITWTDESSTPKLIRSIVSMLYSAAIYERAYGDDHDDAANYAGWLRSLAEANIQGLIAGTLEIIEDDSNLDDGSPVFFPTDLSSSQPATKDNPSDGGPYFTMGMVF